MTEGQRYEIAVLAEDYERKRAAFEMHRMANSSGLTPEERVEQCVAYHIAETELTEAYIALQTAKAVRHAK